MMLHIRHMPERNKRQENPSLKGDMLKLCSNGGLLSVHLKSHNIQHQLRIEKLMSL